MEPKTAFEPNKKTPHAAEEKIHRFSKRAKPHGPEDVHFMAREIEANM